MQPPAVQSAFPSLMEYLQSMPLGPNAVPSCTAVGGYCNLLRKQNPDILLNKQMPALIRLKMQSTWSDTDWINCALQVCIVLAIYDQKGQDRPAARQALNRAFTEMCKQPLYRVVMMVLSPSLVMSGAAKRWHYFFRGCDLTSVVRQDHAVLTLTAPPNLFPRLYCEIFSEVFAVAVLCAGAKHATSQLSSWTATTSVFEVTW